MGKRPIPTHLAVVDKAHAYRHHNQPEPSKERPEPPERLSAEAKVIFNRMVERISELYPVSKSHTEMLTIYAESEELAIHLDALLRKEGLIYECVGGKSGIITYKARPEVKMLDDARKRCVDVLREFGLSPSSQRNVKVEKKQSKVNAFANLDKAQEG